ncbi:GHKL domain-containing protein [Bacillus sp. V5-8f]|uniref:GHKL domain-containing protein n=1 Tax=Bacillus sp. V5-8f TaxID=2053044 RepID=UPI0027E5795B|nr:GHKL domain-containing protein [Bacillus sp. V5-8f]
MYEKDDSFNTIKTTDLIKLLSNLIDNAIEATIALPEQERKMNIVCKVVSQLKRYDREK